VRYPIATVAAYRALCDAGIGTVQYGDLGENVLIHGPDEIANMNGNGLYVRARLQIGTTVLELTEANNPCYRFNTQPWASRGRALWGPTAPDGNEAKWFHSVECPLNHQINPGIRGWLARVIKEGEINMGDTVALIHQQETTVPIDESKKDEEGNKNGTVKHERNDGTNDGAIGSAPKRQKMGVK